MSDVATLDVDSARRLTERIRLIAQNVADNVQKLRELVEEAKASGVHETLGYPSWTAYLKDVFGDEPLRLARDVRQELVAELTAQGMSTRAIAPIVGVSQRTVVDDVSSSAHLPEPVINVLAATGEVLDEDERQVQYSTGEWSRTVETKTRTVTGLDGKTYSTPVQKQNRRALTDVAKDAGWDIRKAVERLERIRDDDRYSRNREEIGSLLRSHLLYVIETCQGLLDDLDQSKGN